MSNKPLIGQRFGNLVIVSKGEHRKGHRYWNFMCDCGAEYVSTLAASTTKYPMCSNCRKGQKHYGWQGHGEISKNTFNTIRHGAIAKQLEFRVTIEELWELFVSQNRKCKMTGWDIHFADTYNERHLKPPLLIA